MIHKNKSIQTGPKFNLVQNQYTTHMNDITNQSKKAQNK